MGLAEVLATGSIRTVFQPIVELDSGAVVAYEALSRGPVGPWERPDRLFEAARAEGRLAELDGLCRRTALQSAAAAGLVNPLTLFVNVEPQVLDAAPLDELIAVAEAAPGGMRVVLEITERALGARPAELLACVRRLRAAGWRIALDDVGADDLSLAFMPLLRPDIVKLDLKFVQDRPGPAVAGIMNAVNAYAQNSGALVLAEGIEDETHLGVARALGATLGQGWMFGRPSGTLSAALPGGALQLAPPTAGEEQRSPFGCLPPGQPLRRSSKPLLIELSKHLEREALRYGSTCVVVSTFQHVRHFTPATAHRYRELAERVAFVAAIGDGLGGEPVRGVRGANILAEDPLLHEWDIAVLSPHFAAALLARDLGDSGPDLGRTFEFALTYDRATVAAAAASLLARVLPAGAAFGHPPAADPPAARSTGTTRPWLAAAVGRDVGAGAAAGLAATSNGVSIVDVTRADHPLVYVNAAFERLSGLRAEQTLGTNCRILQGPDTDPDAVSRIRDAIRQGLECRKHCSNYRGHAREPWWNEIYLAPVFDDDGRSCSTSGCRTTSPPGSTPKPSWHCSSSNQPPTSPKSRPWRSATP